MTMTIFKQILQLRKRSLIAIAILFVIAMSLQLYISLYQTAQVEQESAEWMKLREQEGRGATLQTRENLYKSGLADLAKFRERIYPKSQFARFIGELYEKASENGLEIVSITYKPALVKEDQLLNYSLTLLVSGKYTQLKKFIYALGAGDGNILVIDSIAIAASGAAAESVQLQLSISSWFTLEAK